MSVIWYEGKVIKIETVTNITKRFYVEVENMDVFNFAAGQFVTMDLPIHERKPRRMRSYSIASSPTGTNILEFCIVYIDGGLASNYFFNDVKEGASITFRGPLGKFVLPPSIDKNLVLICTGTGVAPFRSMIWDILANKKQHKDIHLIFGTRYADGILYRDEFEKLVTQIPGFSYSVALSRETALPTAANWQCLSGYVHQIYLNHYPEYRDDIQFYLCGWRNMIDEAVTNLKEKLGYNKSDIHYELYG